jgi:hypothetical protein
MPKQLQCSAIKRLIDRGLWEQGIRHQLKNGERRHEFKTDLEDYSINTLI